MRSAFGRSSSCGATPSSSTAAPALACTICQPRSTTTHGWVVGVQDSLNTLADGGHVGVAEGAFTVDGREAGGHQQLVLFTKRHVEHPCEAQHHRSARGRSASLDETDVPRRHVGLDREIELGQPPALSPLTHHRAERATLDLGGRGHAPSVAYGRERSHYLSGNCVPYLGVGTMVA